MTERIVAAFVPLVDCAVLVAAREQGFAAAAGLDLVLVKEPSWASLRDHLCLGHVDCAHALAPLPVALTLGVGHVQVDCVAPFVLGRGGNAVTVSTRLFDEMYAKSRRGELRRPRARRAARSRPSCATRAPLTLGMVFPFSNHNFDLRYWLAAAGVHPDRDVRLVAIPPPLMVDSLRAGLVDGFCVGEPWNSLAVAQGSGRIVATQSQLFPRAVEKVLAMRASFAERRETFCKRLLQALDAAAAWADDAANHAALAALLARPEYLGVPPESIAAALDGRLRLGVGRRKARRRFHVLSPPRRERAACSRWPVGVRADGSVGAARAERAGRNAPPPKCFVPISIARVCRRRRSPRRHRRRSIASSSSRRTCRAYLAQFDVHTPFADAHSL